MASFIRLCLKLELGMVKLILILLASLLLTTYLEASNSINVISVDGCFLPEDFDLLEGKQINVENLNMTDKSRLSKLKVTLI